MKLNPFSVLIRIFIVMKNIFTTKVSWFKPTPTPKDHEWTHIYTNMLGNPVKCIITKNRKDYVWVLNENGCGVKKTMEDLRVI
jgi:hypothetical protein